MVDFNRLGPAEVPADAVPVLIPMRDGARLAADVYPQAEGRPAPVVLVRLPYDKDGTYCFMPEVARYFAGHGFGVVVQDVRGKFRSDGPTEFAVHEVADGYDTLDWVASQPWCDGSVVMWGDSYFGFTQLAAVVGGHPALRAICPRVTGSQLSLRLEHQDGSTDVESTVRPGYFATHYVGNDTYEWLPDWSRRPLVQAFEDFFASLGQRSASFDREMGGTGILRQFPVTDLVAAAPVPALYTIGWFDNCAHWSWADVRALMADPRWRPHLYLRIEPTDHESYHLSEAPVAAENDHGVSAAARAAALPRFLDPAIEFYRHVLNGTEPASRVRYEIAYGGWHSADTWPPAETHSVTYYLSPPADGQPTGQLCSGVPAPAQVTWTQCGDDLVPSVSANPFALLYDRDDLAPVGNRDDVLAFTGPVAEADVLFEGPMELTGTIQSSIGSADVFARLLDQHEDGRAFLIARGNTHLAGRRGGQPFRVDLLEAGYRLAAGHRLLLHVYSSDFPEYIYNVPPGENPWLAPKVPTWEQTLTLGGPGAAALRVTVRRTPGTHVGRRDDEAP